jgi:hypothetical protein
LNTNLSIKFTKTSDKLIKLTSVIDK